MPFQKGVVTNPNGAGRKPREKLISDYLVLSLKEAAKNGEGPRARELADAIVERAIQGDMRAAEIVLERMEGKMAQQLDISVEHSVGAFLEVIGAQQLHLVGQNEQNAQIAEVIEETTH